MDKIHNSKVDEAQGYSPWIMDTESSPLQSPCTVDPPRGQGRGEGDPEHSLLYYVNLINVQYGVKRSQIR